MRRFQIAVLVSCVAGMLVSAERVHAKDYPIKLARPDKIGKKYRLTARETKKREMSVLKGETVVKSENTKTTVALRAVIEVLKVDKKGEPLKKKITIEKFTDDADKELLKKGDVVIAQTVEGKTAYRMKGNELPARAKEFLGDLVKTRGKAKSDDDEVFGSKKRRKVGESWKINSQAMAKDLELKAKDINGTVTLQAIEKHKGTDCLRIGIDIEVTSAPKSASLAERGFAVGKANMRMKLGGLVPVDSKQDSPAEWLRVTTKAEYAGSKPATKAFRIRINVELTINETMTYLK